MAWNKPQEAATKAAPKKKPTAWRGAAAGIVALAVAAVVALFVLTGKDAKPVATAEKKAAVIKEVAPAVIHVTNETESAGNGVWKPPKGAYQDEKGVWHYRGGVRIYDPTKSRKPISLRFADEKESPFHYRCEREIERLLTTEPGRPMFGTRKYDERFLQDYQESLKEPIIISEEDSEEDKKLKRMMIETKIEISDRMKNGESLKGILEGARSELQRMAQYKRMLSQEINNQLQNGNLSDADFDDYIAAANKMLKENGISEIKNVSFLKRNLKLTSKRKKK